MQNVSKAVTPLHSAQERWGPLMPQHLMPVVEQISASCWRLHNRGFDMNSGLVVGQERAAVIDTGSGPREAGGLYQAIRKITDLPLVVVNTHAHGDHAFGNSYFAAHGVQDFYISAEAAEHLRERGEAERQLVRFLEPEMAMGKGEYSRILVPKNIVDESGVTLDLGSVTLEIFGRGQGHTGGDLLVRSGNILFTGDLVEQGGPPNFEDADPFAWSTLLGALEAECSSDTVVVPGHGHVVDKEFVGLQHREMIAAIREGQEIIASRPAGRFDPTAYQLQILPYGPEQSAIFLQRLVEIRP
ncbi:MBL fold metallo-hydrolase [Paeniglutamicibacter terrestris]|uniref:MBL fold metallo-hydrolase n=1 Tax=Paeniglutamicibacter terrestris TaxID=2723403 RepID=UPI000B5E7184|nr:MBL fold metallo-hydrolase [Arthrobacter sp. 7749]